MFKKIDGKRYKFMGSAAKGPASERLKSRLKTNYKSVRAIPSTNVNGTPSKKSVDLYAWGKL